ncbi:MAG: hypothetical protein ABSA47_02070 [Verrucomicrobiota bacterium]|jgi:hypothetical protein
MKPIDKAKQSEKRLSLPGFLLPKSGGAKLGDWQKMARGASWNNLVWKWRRFGISDCARRAAEDLDLLPSEVFAHPDLMATHPELAGYYSFVASLPRKGRVSAKCPADTSARLAFCRLVNRSSSSLLTTAAKLSRESRFNPIFAGAAKKQGNCGDTILRPKLAFIEMLVNFAIEHDLVDWEATERLADEQFENGRETNQIFD